MPTKVENGGVCRTASTPNYQRFSAPEWAGCIGGVTHAA